MKKALTGDSGDEALTSGVEAGATGAQPDPAAFAADGLTTGAAGEAELDVESLSAGLLVPSGITGMPSYSGCGWTDGAAAAFAGMTGFGTGADPIFLCQIPMYTNIRMRTAPEKIPIVICSVFSDAWPGISEATFTTGT